MEVRCDGPQKWVASGSGLLEPDTWDFDWRLGQYIGGVLGWGPGNGRGWFGQTRTMAGSFIPGQSFDVTSESVSVFQLASDNSLSVF